MKRLLRYVWPAILLVAAVLAPSLVVGITLAAGAVISLLLVTPKSVEPALNSSRRHLLLTAGAGELLIFISMLLGLDVTTARNYALLVLVAAAPLGLELTVAWLLRAKHTSASETIKTAVAYASEDAHTLTFVIGLSFAGTVLLDIPPALSVLQLLLISCVARPLLSGRALQAMPHKADQRWRVLYGGLTVYGSFVFFYIRHYLNPLHADVVNPTTWQATTVAMAVFIACQAALVGFNPKAPKVTAYRLAVLFIALLFVVYLPWLHHLFTTSGLAAADWAWVIVAGLLYAALIILHSYFSTHSRRSVLALHREASNN